MPEPHDEKVVELEQLQNDSQQTDDLKKEPPTVETIVDEIKVDCRHLPQEYIDEVDIPGGGE